MKKNIFLTIWEFPQKICALIVKKIFKGTEYTTYKDAKIYSWNRNDGISLSNCIFVPFDKGQDPNSEYIQNYIKHEYGHTIQSKYLGLFYLLIVGLPSIIWAGCFKNYRKKNNISYYSFYTESWANRLGGSNFK